MAKRKKISKGNSQATEKKMIITIESKPRLLARLVFTLERTVGSNRPIRWLCVRELGGAC